MPLNCTDVFVMLYAEEYSLAGVMGEIRNCTSNTKMYHLALLRFHNEPTLKNTALCHATEAYGTFFCCLQSSTGCTKLLQKYQIVARYLSRHLMTVIKPRGTTHDHAFVEQACAFSHESTSFEYTAFQVLEGRKNTARCALQWSHVPLHSLTLCLDASTDDSLWSRPPSLTPRDS